MCALFIAILSLLLFIYIFIILMGDFLKHRNKWDERKSESERQRWERISSGVQEGITGFIETGKKFDEQFHDLLSNYPKKERDRIIFATAKARKSHVETRDLQLNQFKSWQECPACTKQGNFMFEDLWLQSPESIRKLGPHRSMIRVCSYCDHKWYQS